MNSKQSRLLLGFILLLCFNTAFSQQAIVLSEKSKSYPLGKSLLILTDDDKTLTSEGILSRKFDSAFVQSEVAVPNFGYRDANFWFKLKVQDLTSPLTQWYLQSTRTQMDSITVYFVAKDRMIVKSAGDLYPFSAREVKHHTFLFSIPKFKEVDIYIFCRGTFSKQFPFQIVEKKQFAEESHKQDVFMGTYFGIFLAMVLFNLLLYFSLKSRSYLYYVLFMGFFLLAQLALTGYGHELFFHSWLRFANISNMLFIGLTCFFASLFTRRFLSVDELSPNSSKALYLVDTLSLVLVIMSLVAIFYDSWVLKSSQFAAYVGGVTALVLFPVGVVIYRKGYRPALFYLIAWTFLFLGVIVFALKNNAILPQNRLTDLSMQIGTVLEALLLSLGLADRVKSAEKEKAEAQKSVIEALKENERLIVDQNRNLEAKVEERTREIVEKNVEIEQQLEEIAAQRDMLSATMLELERQNDNIKSSINYANRIQKAMLPQEDKILNTFSDSFILFRPRDIVSGDFYWYSEIGQKRIFVVADCTGHGVPGAFMSMIGVNLLNEIVNVRVITNPTEILNQLHKGIQKSLQQEFTHTRDGMDLALVVIDQKTKQIHYAGAKNPLIYIENKELTQLKADKFPVGGYENKEGISFSTQSFAYTEDTCVYMFSDGYQDQFGGHDDKKFMIKQLRELIHKIHQEPMPKQKEILEETLNNWIGPHRQIDDILLVGFRV